MRTGLYFIPALSAIGLLFATAASSASPRRADDDARAAGHVYTESNLEGGNSILVFDRTEMGEITLSATIPTGGNGTGAGLGSQGAIAASEDGAWLLAVNAGSDTLSLFRREGGTLKLRDVVASGGSMPVSVTSWGGLVYVLNAGATQNISGFYISSSGQLLAIDGSTRPLSAEAVGAAEVLFSPNGDAVVVTEKGTNRIDTFRIDRDGSAAPGTFINSVGLTPYGFDFTPNGFAIVSDAEGAMAGLGAVTSYRVRGDGSSVVGGAVGDDQTAPCWVVTSNDGRYAYTTNAASGTISSYRVSDDGALSLVTPGGDTANTGTGSHPADLALSPNGAILFTLTTGAGTITSLGVHEGGSLTAGSTVAGIPAHAAGLIAL